MLKGIKASVLDLSPIYQEVAPHAALQQSVVLAQTAEALGYSRYWVSEHHDMPQFASSTPEVLLAHIGAKTSRIRIGSGAVLLPNYRPYKVGEAFALLATLYPGRIDLGIGRAPGGSAHASLAISGSFLAQVGKMEELVGDLSAILANEFTVEGQPVIARPIPPAPAQLWMLGTNRKSAELAAKFGSGYVFGHFMSEQPGEEAILHYCEQFQASRHHEKPQVILAVSVYCAATEEEASRMICEKKEGSRSTKMIIGTSKQLAPILDELVAKFRADELMIITDVPDYQKRLGSYKRLAHLVLSLGSIV